MGEMPRGLGSSWYAGMSLEAGNAWAKRSDISFSNTRKAISAFLGLDTLLGPLYLGYGHTFSGDSSIYLFLGRPTDR
jgi:NTE family protein